MSNMNATNNAKNESLAICDSNVANNEKDQKVEVDVAIHFENTNVFSTKEELVNWARCVGKSIGYVVTIMASDKVIGRLKPRVLLGCDRSGYYRENQNKKGWVKKGLRRSASKRCGCLFALKGQKVANVDEWRLEVLCGVHNHNKVHLEAHAYAGRLDIEEVKLVEQMYSAGVKPRKILTAVKGKNVANTTVMRTIYNARAKLHKKQLEGHTPIQFLYKCVDDAGYVSFNKVNESTKNLHSLFFAHPTSIKLSNMFPTVFQLDCTYKTNRYRMPLLCIVGMTSTSKSFYSCFTFLSDETQSSYEWALNCFKSILTADCLPTVMVTDRELALMKAITSVFPEAKNILCRVHINRNILANCKKLFSNGQDFDKFMFDWQKLIVAVSQSDFNIAFSQLIVEFSALYIDVLEYVTTTWIEPYKEHFMSAWIDKYLHLGNSCTNLVEGGHSQLKKWLEVSIVNMSTIWKTFDQMILLQHVDIKRSFGESCIKISKDYTGTLYSHIIGKVSINALRIIQEDEDLVKKGEHFPLAHECSHYKRYTLGLPCAHELLPYITNGKGFPLWLIHAHWKQLVINDKFDMDMENNLDIELELVAQKFYDSNEQQKKEIKHKMREIIDPTLSQT